MKEPQILDPRVQGLEKKAKVIGVAAVTVVAAATVAITGGAVIVAGVTVVVALAVVNFVPVFARRMALWKQSKLTELAEEFSEETLREDEQEEERRVSAASTAYQAAKAEIEGAIEELREQLNGASADEQGIINSQITAMKKVIQDQFDALQTSQSDLKELKRVNSLLIAMDRSARAINKAQGEKRNPEEQQRLVTARNAIKTRMRKAVAGQEVAAMERSIHSNKRPHSVTQIGHSEPEVLQVLNPEDGKEKVHVPRRH